jgi:hypothetical protein
MNTLHVKGKTPIDALLLLLLNEMHNKIEFSLSY